MLSINGKFAPKQLLLKKAVVEKKEESTLDTTNKNLEKAVASDDQKLPVVNSELLAVYNGVINKKGKGITVKGETGVGMQKLPKEGTIVDLDDLLEKVKKGEFKDLEPGQGFRDCYKGTNNEFFVYRTKEGNLEVYPTGISSQPGM